MTRLLVLVEQTFEEVFATMNSHDHAAPTSPAEYAIAAFGSVIVLLIVIFTIKYFVRPREESEEHIKRRILREEG